MVWTYPTKENKCPVRRRAKIIVNGETTIRYKPKQTWVKKIEKDMIVFKL